MAQRIVTQPTVEPVAVARVKEHLKVTNDVEDSLIAEYLVAARKWCEEFTERAFIFQDWICTFDEFPLDMDEGLPIPRPRLLETDITVTYTDLNGDEVELDETDFRIDAYSEPGVIYPLYNELWPADARIEANVITVEYTCGYGAAASDVPDDIKQAIRILTAHWYMSREPIVTGTIIANIPFTVESLLMPYRVGLAQYA